MTYKDILVHVSRDRRSPARLDAAIGLAERYEGRVTGVYVLPAPSFPSSANFQIPEDVLEDLDRQQREWAADAERAFAERMAKTAVPSEWRLLTGDPIEAVTTSSRYADITVVGQSHDDDDASVSGLADRVVLGAGGPVLVWPYTGSFDINAGTVMVAWNGCREAKRALSDALPLLQSADKAIVFGVDSGDGRHVPGADVSTHLARHGVTVEAEHTVASSDISDADLLLSAIGDHGADLLVMGAYGHRRLRELLLGGATRAVLSQMTAPVLMSH